MKHWRFASVLAAVFGLAIGVPTVRAQDEGEKAAQNKLLAKRAAEADAYRKLAETIRGLQINATTYVRDFVAESDIIQTEMDAFIRGVRLGKPKYYEDGSCEVPAEVTVAKVITTLKQIHSRHYKGDKIKASDFEQMTQTIKKSVIKVVGMGAPREELPLDLPAGVAEKLGGPPPAPSPPLPALWLKMGPQARLMAKQAARTDAQRRLVERIIGLRITSDTLVRDFVAESDQINTEAQGMLVGATEKRTYYHHDEPIVEVTMRVPTEQVITIVKELHARHYKGDKVKATDITNVKQTIRKKTFEATGMGVARGKAMQVYEQAAKVNVPDWATTTLNATGQAALTEDTPQAKLMAARAAELDAKRKLAEQVQGLRITSETTVRDFVAERDEISTQLDGVLVGSHVTRTDYPGDGTAQVTVALPAMQVWTIIYRETKVRMK